MLVWSSADGGRGRCLQPLARGAIERAPQRGPAWQRGFDDVELLAQGPLGQCLGDERPPLPQARVGPQCGQRAGLPPQAGYACQWPLAARAQARAGRPRTTVRAAETRHLTRGIARAASHHVQCTPVHQAMGWRCACPREHDATPRVQALDTLVHPSAWPSSPGTTK